MPYLQLDVTKSYPPATKQLLAKLMGDAFSRIMQANVARVTVSIRELGEGNIWRCSQGEPIAAALLMCDIRSGRSKDIRGELARTLIEICVELLGIKSTELNVEFTQHSGEDMYHPDLGGLSDDWDPNED